MKKKMIAMALATIVAIPTAAFAAENQASKKLENALEKAPLLRAEGKFAHHFAKHLQMSEQKEQKLLQIAKKYAPKYVSDLQQTIDKRQELLKEWRALKPKEIWKEKREELMKEREAKLDELLDQLTSGKITKEEFKQKLKEAREQRKEQLKQWKEKQLPMAKEAAEKEREFRKQFREAIKTNNEKEIAKLLPQFIQHLQAGNQKLEKLIQTMKQN
ncbi:hypothetical protein [Anoxybacteroides tepidamans]|uniref:hypothetical protein n=1 Tax=Anoxybacteroides tepidamans TaxID=265948 RepID=UPI000486D585|nr:hypothetical protein [Anoxybacillus tepidamans]